MTAAVREALEVVAGPGAYGRGATYAATGRVGSLRERVGVLTAVVDGTEPYTVRVRASDDPNELAGECSCPVDRDGGFCKHSVATVLAWLDERVAGERGRGADLLVRILLDERDHDQAWAAAIRHGASNAVWLDLARLRGREHPADVVPVYRRLAEAAIAGGDRAALLTELRELAPADCDAALAALRAAHPRKRALLDELARAERRWT